MKTLIQKLNKKSLVAVTLVLLSLVGCGDKGSNNNSGTSARYTMLNGNCVDQNNSVVAPSACGTQCVNTGVNTGRYTLQGTSCYDNQLHTYVASYLCSTSQTGTCSTTGLTSGACSGQYMCYGAPTQAQGGSCGVCGAQGVCTGYLMYNSYGQQVQCTN